MSSLVGVDDETLRLLGLDAAPTYRKMCGTIERLRHGATSTPPPAPATHASRRYSTRSPANHSARQQSTTGRTPTGHSPHAAPRPHRTRPVNFDAASHPHNEHAKQEAHTTPSLRYVQALRGANEQPRLKLDELGFFLTFVPISAQMRSELRIHRSQDRMVEEPGWSTSPGA